MRYDFTCGEHNLEVEASIKDGPPSEVVCEVCGETMRRVYNMPSVEFHCDGFYSTDYTNDTRTGDKLTQLNESWSKATGEKPPPMASDVPRNSKEKY